MSDGVSKFGGGWDALKNLVKPEKFKAATEGAFGSALKKAAQVVRRNAVLGIRNQRAEWPPLAEEFPGKKKLIDTGQLIRSIVVQFPEAGVAFVGIPTSARYRDGTSLALVAAVHEHSAFILRGKGAIYIPARPWLAPAVGESEEAIADAFETEFAGAFGKVIG